MDNVILKCVKKMHQKIKLKDYQKTLISKLRPKNYKEIIYFIENYMYIKRK
jgi:hypothetical protein